jgi:hypothetical protein
LPDEDDRPTTPPPATATRSGILPKNDSAPTLEGFEEPRPLCPLWDSREPEPAVHEILYRFALGDWAGAIAAADLLLEGRRVPALCLPLDFLQELEVELDYKAYLLLAQVDGKTPLSEVLAHSFLSYGDALHTFCSLVEQRIILLRRLP